MNKKEAMEEKYSFDDNDHLVNKGTDPETQKNISRIHGNAYHSRGINDLALPARIMKFVRDNAELSHQGQGVIGITCKQLWDMTPEEFEATFDIKVQEEKI